jgi:hypothetical protein
MAVTSESTSSKAPSLVKSGTTPAFPQKARSVGMPSMLELAQADV